jgi:phosphopantothenoylcysteine decarboxylase / phosphopantothenate---cysteine ligase
MRLTGKNIILGITGSIAAYKAAILVRLFVKEGAEVKVVMTPCGKEFITPVTLATLSKNTVLTDFFKYDDGSWNSHVDLGLWADLMLIAPASANTIAKMANGICDNLLLTTYLSARCPVMVAPAMDLDMFKHPSTLKNMDVIRSYGNIIVEPSSGELASGLYGKGRMEEPEALLENVVELLSGQHPEKKKLGGKRILITAGPTHERIDPVRYIGNSSSGKMGIAIADALAEMGANVELVLGPVHLFPAHASVKTHQVVSAEEMYRRCIEIFPSCDAAVMAAAVADYAPRQASSEKIKKISEDLILELSPTKDIAAKLGGMKKSGQILAGFALETENEVENAKKKLQSKNLDFIVLNSLRDEGAGFALDTNRISILDADGSCVKYDVKPKGEVARDIADKLISCFSR